MKIFVGSFRFWRDRYYGTSWSAWRANWLCWASILPLGTCDEGGDWWTNQINLSTRLTDFNEYFSRMAGQRPSISIEW